MVDTDDPANDEYVLEMARRVMRRRRPQKTHWMLLDTPAAQEEWDRNYPNISVDRGLPVAATVVFTALCLAILILAGLGLVYLKTRFL